MLLGAFQKLHAKGIPMPMTFRRIVVAQENYELGYSILLRAGTIIYTGIPRTYVVVEEEGGIQKLREAGIRFEIVPHVIDGKG